MKLSATPTATDPPGHPDAATAGATARTAGPARARIGALFRGPARHRTRGGPRAWRAILALILREIESRYGRSPGGYLWAVAEPVAGIALLSLVFGLIVHAPSLGTNFALFYATGLLPFLIYVQVAQAVATSIRFSQPLLSYPAVALADALIARFALNAVTQLVVFALVMTGVIWGFGLHPILDWGAIARALAMVLALAAAVGVANCYLFAALPAWERVWAIVNRPLFLISGILFVPEDVPARYRDLILANPLIHATSEMRRGFYPTYEAVHVVPLMVWLVALAVAVPALALLLRTHKDLVLR